MILIFTIHHEELIPIFEKKKEFLGVKPFLASQQDTFNICKFSEKVTLVKQYVVIQRTALMGKSFI